MKNITKLGMARYIAEKAAAYPNVNTGVKPLASNNSGPIGNSMSMPPKVGPMTVKPGMPAASTAKPMLAGGMK
jgi:hypothetical protein